MSNFDFCQPFARLVQKKSKIMLGERENYRSIWTKIHILPFWVRDQI